MAGRGWDPQQLSATGQASPEGLFKEALPVGWVRPLDLFAAQDPVSGRIRTAPSIRTMVAAGERRRHPVSR